MTSNDIPIRITTIGWRRIMRQSIRHLTHAEIVGNPWQLKLMHMDITNTATEQIVQGHVGTSIMQYHQNTNPLQGLTDARRKRHQHARVSDMRQTRISFSRYVDITDQSWKGAEDTDGKLQQDDASDKLDSSRLLRIHWKWYDKTRWVAKNNRPSPLKARYEEDDVISWLKRDEGGCQKSPRCENSPSPEVDMYESDNQMHRQDIHNQGG